MIDGVATCFVLRVAWLADPFQRPAVLRFIHIAIHIADRVAGGRGFGGPGRDVGVVLAARDNIKLLVPSRGSVCVRLCGGGVCQL